MYCFGKKVSAKANVCLNKSVFKEFWRGFCCHSSDISMADSQKYEFIIGDPSLCEDGGGLYCINADEKGVLVTANDVKGLICGYMDLLGRIKVLATDDGRELFGIESCRASVSPKVRNRMIHYCVFPETKYYEMQRFIRLCGFLGYTHIVFEFWGMLRFDVLKELSWPHAFTKAEIKPLFDEANDLGIEIIPMFNHWGHASASRANHGKHVVLDQNLKLQPLFSDDGWTWKIETEKVREFMQSIRNELIELCGEGGYFHLGCDEPYNFKLNEKTAHTVVEYLNEIQRELKEAGRRAIVWGDMLVSQKNCFITNNRYTASCPNETIEKLFLSRLDKNIIIADWQYNVSEAPVETALIFKNAGFDVLLCPWDKTYGDDSLPPCVKTVSENALFGLLHTTWHTLSVGMPDVTRAADLCWEREKYGGFSTCATTRTAAFIRKTCHPQGDYEKSGWATFEISNKTF